jgi:serine/threonine protein kinase
MDPALIKESFWKEGITDVSFKESNREEHLSDYGTGRYRGSVVGIVFGRKAEIYERGAEALSRLSHRGVPQFYRIGTLSIGNSNPGYMLTQHFPGNKLGDSLDFFSEDGRKRCVGTLLEIVNIIDYIHSKDVVHCDIRAEHVIVNDEGPHIVDFHLWANSTEVPPTADFCGWYGLPRIVAEELFAKPKLLTMEQAEANYWDFGGYGIMLKEIIPSRVSDPFIEWLKNIADFLTKRSMKYVEHPFSRDRTSNKIRESLEELAMQGAK